MIARDWIVKAPVDLPPELLYEHPGEAETGRSALRATGSVSRAGPECDACRYGFCAATAQARDALGRRIER